MAKWGLSRTKIDETQYRRKEPCTEVRAVQKRVVYFPGHEKVKAAIERRLAMIYQNHTPGCHSCQNGSAKNPLTRWGRGGSDAPPCNRRRQPTLEPTPDPPPPLPGTPPTLTGKNSGAHLLEFINLPAGYAYPDSSLPCAASSSLDSSSQNGKHDTGFDLVMLPD